MLKLTHYSMTLILIASPLFSSNAAEDVVLSAATIPSIKYFVPTIDHPKNKDLYFHNKKLSRIESNKAQELEKIAILGDSEAQKILGDHYRQGRGVAKSDAVALMWYIISEENGFKKADRELSLTKSYMAFDQINLAEQMADKWLLKNN